MSVKSVEERAKELVDPRKFKRYEDYQFALAKKEQELRLSDAQWETAERERQIEHERRVNSIRHQMDSDIERASSGMVTGHTTVEEAEAELRRQDSETRNMQDMYR